MHPIHSPNAKPPESPQELAQLCHWIEEHIDQQIGWTDLVAQSGMDHTTLQKQFNLYFRTSPMQWIRSKRLERTQRQVSIMSAALPIPNALKMG